MEHVFRQRETWEGLLFGVMGIYLLYKAGDYPMATLLRRGPEYFPSLVGWLLVALGATIAGRIFPNGLDRAEAMLNDDGVDIGRPLRSAVGISVAGNSLTVDFSGTAAQAMGPINSGLFGGAHTAARGRYNLPMPTAIDLIIKALTGAVPERGVAAHFGTLHQSSG